METALISMDPVKAREAWKNYLAAVKKRHTAEDEILMRGYKHLAQGKKVLDLIDVMRAAGVDDQGRPQLAIARASWEKCWLYKYQSGETRFTKERWVKSNAKRSVVNLPPDTFPWRAASLSNFSSRVPAIPPQFKPHGSLENYFILWDATWEAEPPTDPILLRHLGRNVYAVLAAWDLTPLERALLR